MNECLRVHVGEPLFFVRPQWSIKEVLGVCQCALMKVSRAARCWTVEWLKQWLLTATVTDTSFIRGEAWHRPGSSHPPKKRERHSQAHKLEIFHYELIPFQLITYTPKYTDNRVAKIMLMCNLIPKY